MSAPQVDCTFITVSMYDGLLRSRDGGGQIRMMMQVHVFRCIVVWPTQSKPSCAQTNWDVDQTMYDQTMTDYCW